MASGAEKKMTQHLDCAICWDKFKEPKVLSCQHTFCRECLEELVIEAGTCVAKCPVCRRTTLIPGGDAKYLPSNFLINKLLAELSIDDGNTVAGLSCEKHHDNE